MNSLQLLLQNSPPWVTIEKRWKDGAAVTASPSLASGRAEREFYLELRPSDRHGVCVMEQAERRQFPEFCLERHINPSSTFCVFFRSEARLRDPEEAAAWWSSLGSFLNNQVYAEKHRVWPLAAGLSHGDAAGEQVAMEELAEPLGWKDELWRGMFRGKGWMSKRLPRVSKALARVVNARMPCPRGCTWKHRRLRQKSCEAQSCYADCKKQHKPVLRADCPYRETVEALVLHEHRRREIEARIVAELIEEGKRCCRTMKMCPLRQDGECYSPTGQ